MNPVLYLREVAFFIRATEPSVALGAIFNFLTMLFKSEILYLLSILTKCSISKGVLPLDLPESDWLSVLNEGKMKPQPNSMFYKLAANQTGLVRQKFIGTFHSLIPVTKNYAHNPKCFESSHVGNFINFIFTFEWYKKSDKYYGKHVFYLLA